MQELQFLVQGSSPEPYRVTFTIVDKNLNAYCTCPAGQNGQYCKHRFGLLAGDTRKLVGPNEDEVRTLLQWLEGSDVEEALEAVHAAERDFLRAKKALAEAKKNVALAMRK
jgi:uncharacterized Zn finger protein